MAQENGSTEVVGFKVFVGNLSYEVDTEKLTDFFGKVGKVYGRIEESTGWSRARVARRDDDNYLVCVYETASMNLSCCLTCNCDLPSHSLS